MSLRQAGSLGLSFHGEKYTQRTNYPRSLSLHNLDFGYPGRVFPASVGQDLPSKMRPTGCLRVSASWFRRGGLVGWGWCPPDAPFPKREFDIVREKWLARGRWLCHRKPDKAPQHAQAYRGMLYRVNKPQIRLRQKAT